MNYPITFNELGDSSTYIDDTFGQGRVEWNYGRPVIHWSESMKFHVELLREGETLNADADDFTDRVQAALRVLLPDFEVEVDWSDADDNGFPVLWIQVWLSNKLPLETTQDHAWNLLWPAIATLFNVTDPGAFNSPYLFTALIERN